MFVPRLLRLRLNRPDEGDYLVVEVRVALEAEPAAGPDAEYHVLHGNVHDGSVQAQL